MSYKNKMKKTTILLSSLLLLIIIPGLVSATYKNACLTYGDSVPSKDNPRYTCNSQLCQLCVDSNNFPSAPGYCDKAKPCTPVPNECTKSDAPILNVFTPKENQIFDSRKVTFNITSDKHVTIYYIDNIDGRGRWNKVSSNSVNFVKGITFKDGLNDITIKAVDNCDKETIIVRKFLVDSQKPKISKNLVDGLNKFYIEFSEVNPKNLIVKVGNDVKGYSDLAINLNTCETKNPTLRSCSLELNPSQVTSLYNKYNNQEVSIWYELSDIVNNSAKSKPIKKIVDLTAPVINNPTSIFSINGKYVTFNISITEQYLKDVTYTDQSTTNPKAMTLCTTLKNNICNKKVTFQSGSHDVDIKITDDSGNVFTKNIDFTI